MEELEQKKRALFNAALGVTVRLNSILNDCMVSARRLDPVTWYHALLSLDKEIDCKMNDDERKKSKQNLKDIHTELIKHQNQKKKINGIPGKLYTTLSECEKHLRQLADKYELLNPSKKMTDLFEGMEL